jgi:hypothetical protein
MTCLRITFCIALLVVVAGTPRSAVYAQPDAAQSQDALPQDPLQLATEVGRYLFAYDQAAGRAATMLLSEEASTEGVQASIARQHEDGHWTVGFGRRTGGGGFRLMHEVVMNDDRLVDEVRAGVSERLPPESYYARAARAQRFVQENFDGEHGPYNFLVLPVGAEAGRMTVYAIPAQTDQNAYRLGGDYRFEVNPAAGEVVSREPLHKRYYEIGKRAQGTGGTAHEATRPVETDVLFATVRRPAAPHFVMTQEKTFRIAPDGTITPVDTRTARQREDVRVLRGM